MVCGVEEEQRRKWRKIFRDGKRVVMSAGKKEKEENIWRWKIYPLNVADFEICNDDRDEKVTCGRPYLHFDWNIWPQATSLLRC